MRKTSLLPVIFTCFTVFTDASFLSASSPEAGDKTPGLETIAKGESLFNHHCIKCHGQKASGTDKGPPLVHRIYHPNHHSDLSFHWAAQRGVKAHHWSFGDMPKVEDVRKDEMDAIIIYVRDLQKKAGIF